MPQPYRVDAKGRLMVDERGNPMMAEATSPRPPALTILKSEPLPQASGVTADTPRLRPPTLPERANEAAMGVLDTVNQQPLVRAAGAVYTGLAGDPARGAVQAAQGAGQVAMTGAVPGSDPREMAQGVTNLLQGTARAAAPLAVPALATQPVLTAITLASSELAREGGRRAGEALGLPPEISEAAGEVAAAVVLGVGVHRFVGKVEGKALEIGQRIGETVKAHRETARAAQDARSLPEPPPIETTGRWEPAGEATIQPPAGVPAEAPAVAPAARPVVVPPPAPAPAAMPLAPVQAPPAPLETAVPVTAQPGQWPPTIVASAPLPEVPAPAPVVAAEPVVPEVSPAAPEPPPAPPPATPVPPEAASPQVVMSEDEWNRATMAERIAEMRRMAPPEAAAATPDGVTRIQWMRNAQGGQTRGNRETIRPITEDDFQTYVKPKLRPGYAATLAEYQSKHPEETHFDIIDVEGNDRLVTRSGSLQELLAMSEATPWAMRVSSHDSPEAKAFAVTADQPIGSPVPETAVAATPDRRWHVGRGMHGNVEVVAPSAIEKTLFTYAARVKAMGTGRNPKPFPEQQAMRDFLAKALGIHPDAAWGKSLDYRRRVLDLTADMKEGDRLDAPAWNEGQPPPDTAVAPPQTTAQVQAGTLKPAQTVLPSPAPPSWFKPKERRAWEAATRAVSLIRELAPQEAARQSKSRRHLIEKADLALRRAAEQLGIKMDRGRSTFYQPETDLASAEHVASAMAEIVPPAPDKEPWQMTRLEFHDALNSGLVRADTTDGRIINKAMKGWAWHADAKHESLVKRAIASGQPVPAEVLADYPDLAPKKAEPPPPTNPAKKPTAAKKAKNPQGAARGQDAVAPRASDRPVPPPREVPPAVQPRPRGEDRPTRTGGDAPAETPAEVAAKPEAAPSLPVIPDIPWQGPKPGTPEHATLEARYQELHARDEKLRGQEWDLSTKVEKTKRGSDIRVKTQARLSRIQAERNTYADELDALNKTRYDANLQIALADPKTPPEVRLAVAETILGRRKQPRINAYDALKAEAERRLVEVGATPEEAKFEAVRLAARLTESPLYEDAWFDKSIANSKQLMIERRALQADLDAYDALEEKYGKSRGYIDYRRKLKVATAGSRKQYLADAEAQLKEEQVREEKAAKERAEAQAVEDAELANDAQVWAAKGQLFYRRVNAAKGKPGEWIPTKGEKLAIEGMPPEFTFWLARINGNWVITEERSGMSAFSGPEKPEVITDGSARILKHKDQLAGIVAKELETAPPKPALQNYEKPTKAKKPAKVKVPTKAETPAQEPLIVETPEEAAAIVKEEIKHVIDTAGYVDAKIIQQKVLATLGAELAGAEKFQAARALQQKLYGERIEAARKTAGEFPEHGKGGEEWRKRRAAAEKEVEPLPPAVDTITIEIPGDGIFTIKRSPEAIRSVIKRITALGAKAWAGLDAASLGKRGQALKNAFAADPGLTLADLQAQRQTLGAAKFPTWLRQARKAGRVPAAVYTAYMAKRVGAR